VWPHRGSRIPAGRGRLPSMGVPALDCDHRCLFRVVDLLSGIEDGAEAATMIETVIETLARYAWFHFLREERVAAVTRYPHAALHTAEHRAFVRLTGDLRRRFDGVAAAEAAAEVRHVLSTWLWHHTLLFDLDLASWITDPEVADEAARRGAALCLMGPEPPQRLPPRASVEAGFDPWLQP